MGKFNYKKWINENKWEWNPKPLNEQGGGSATVKIRRCTNNNLYTYCLPNASSYNVGHQFRFQTFQGIRNGFLESFVQLGCSTPAGGSYSNVTDTWVQSCQRSGGSWTDFPGNLSFPCTVSYSLGQTVSFQIYYGYGLNASSSTYFHHNGASGNGTRYQQTVMEIAQ